jgi:DNA-binding NarL/FixJ family response regulator
MMKRAKLCARQEKMRAKHHSVPRPYDHARGRAYHRKLNRVILMFERGLSIEQIAELTGLSKVGVELYWHNFYLPWKHKITTH